MPMISFQETVLLHLKDSEQPWVWRKVKKYGVLGFTERVLITIKTFSLLVFP